MAPVRLWPRWKEVLVNVKPDTVVCWHRKGLDFCITPTVSFQLLYVWFVIDHGRRRIIHFKVTTNPTAQWATQQLRESLPDRREITAIEQLPGNQDRWRQA